MKIAICFFGHLRTFKRCAPHLKRNLLDQYDCDLFMHTWSTLNHQTITHHENKNIDGIVTDVNVNIRMYNFDDVQCTVIPSVAYGFVTGMNLQLC